MENGIKVSFKYSGISNFQILKYSEDVKKIHKLLEKSTSNKQEFTGWITWPSSMIKKSSKK